MAFEVISGQWCIHNAFLDLIHTYSPPLDLGDIGYIILNTVTGDMTLGGVALDYEVGDQFFNLTVGAIDNPDGTDQLRVSLLAWLAAHLIPFSSLLPQSTDQFVLTVLVGDCNDEPPLFSTSEYDFLITERMIANSSTQTIFSNINTTDADGTASNRAVTYSLADGLSSTLNWLDINPTTVNRLFVQCLNVLPY